MNDHPNVALHKKGHEAFNNADMDTMKSMMTEDTVWRWPGKSPLAGDHRGRSTVLEQFGKMAELTDGNLELKSPDYLSNDTQTVAIFRLTATRGDERLDVKVCEVAEWRDGKVAEEQSFVEDQYAYDDFWS